MNREVVLLILAIALFAAWLVAQVALIIASFRSDKLGTKARWLSLFPPLSPFIAWKGGARAGPIVWSLLLAGYVAVRLVAAGV